MGQPTKSKSFILTSCLVAVSFAIINCQKAPNRNGVKPTVAAPAGTPAGTAKPEEVGKSECSPEAKEAVKQIQIVQDDARISSNGKSESEKNNLIDKRSKFMTNAEALLKELEKLPEKACKMELNSKAVEGSEEAKKNNISLSKTKTAIADIKKLQAEDKGETVTQTEEEKRKAKEEKERLEKQASAVAFLKTNLQLATDEIKDMSADNKDTKFKKFLSNGDIKSERALDLANTNKAVICSISGKEIDKAISKTLTMTFLGEFIDVKAEDKLALEGFKGDAIYVNLIRVKDNTEKAMMDGSALTLSTLTLTCLNMKASAVDVNKLKAAIGLNGTNGKHIKEIKQAELDKLIKENQAKYDLEIAARNQGQNGQTGQAGQTTGQTGQTENGGAAKPADENKTLVAAVTTARMELGMKKQKVEALETRQTTAITEVNAAKDALKKAGADSAELTALAKQLKEAAEAVGAADDALVTAKKGTDKDAIKTAETNLTIAKKALDKLEKDSLSKVKAVGTDKPILTFMTMQTRASKAISSQASIAEELVKEKAKIAGLETKVADAIKAALAKKITQQEIDAANAPAAVPLATGPA